jgi:tetratricopeptide (TPR) repeat protein
MADASIQEAARHYQARDLVQAERCCRAMIAADPRHFDALHLLGVVCVMQDRHADALEFLSRARTEQPNNAQLLFNLGNAHQGLKQHDQAVAAYQHAQTISPGNLGVLNNLGTSLRLLGRAGEAAHCYRDILARQPDHAPAHNNLATALADLGDLEEAAESYRRALAFAPSDTPPDRLASVVNGLGKVLMDLGRHDEALAACRTLQDRHPGLKVVAWNESLALLLRGDYAAGWRKYEARWSVPEHDKPHPDQVVLDLAAVGGKRVLVTVEQGRGDVIQFSRYVPMLVACGARVTFHVYDDLKALLGTMPVVGEAEDPPYDLRTSLLSLPLAFGTTLATVPAAVPYLSAPPDRVALWRARLGPRDRKRIGIAWSGSPASRTRSAIPVGLLDPLLRLGGFEFHLLQKDVTDPHPRVVRHDHRLGDFADTAALIQAMDLVISIDTAVAHLAGALGKPVWIMLPFNPDWRWLLGRDDSPWYPTARLFRQTTRGGWAEVVQHVVAAMIQRPEPENSVQTP